MNKVFNLETVIEQIHSAFDANQYPGDYHLQGSFLGSEPYEEVGPFKGQTHWQNLKADFLDSHADALSFFSDAGFHFFLPAYLIADVKNQLNVANPVLHLTSFKQTFINPKIYGASTWYEYSCSRLSTFTREETSAIVAYLNYKLNLVETDCEKEMIEASLRIFWLKRTHTAPLAEELTNYITKQPFTFRGDNKK